MSTVRFYERSGLLAEPGRTSGGYRDYDEEAVRHLRFLHRGQALGFTLTELREFADLSGAVRSGVVDPGLVAEAADRKLRDLDERITALQETRAAVATLRAQPCPDPSSPCPIEAAVVGELGPPSRR